MIADAADAGLLDRSGYGLVPAGGAELVEVSERFYRGMFSGALAFVGLAALGSLLLLPLRGSPHSGGPPLTALVVALLVAAAPVAVWRSHVLYRVLRGSRALEAAIVAVAAALVVYPLRSELWWPACSLLTLLAILAPLRRALGYCLVVLLANLAAHIIAGDVTTTPAVSIIGLWVGFPFWSATFSVISDRFAAHVMRLQTLQPGAARPVPVNAWVIPELPSAPGSPVEGASGDEDAHASFGEPPAAAVGAMSRLTARQLQVTALLIDGLRYREVAACLSISERQVQRHVANAMVRAGVRSANELIAVAVSERLARPR